MTCNKSPGAGRPKYVDCACGTRVEVGTRGAFPSRCAACRYDKAKRPLTITCRDCSSSVAVGPRGGIPMRCEPCAKRASDAQTLKAKKRLVAERRAGLREEAAEAGGLGPTRPELGLTPAEHQAWREQRIVELYRNEEEMTVDALAERFGLSTVQVQKLLNRAGIQTRGTGRGSGNAAMLPPGLPV